MQLMTVTGFHLVVVYFYLGLGRAQKLPLFNSDDYAHEFVRPRHVRLRSAKGEDDSHLHIDAFGENYRLRLKRADIFSPGFKVFSASLTSNGQTVLTEHNFDKREVGDVYSVDGEVGSLSLQLDDLTSLEGVLGDGTMLKPSNGAASNATHIVYRKKRLLVKPSNCGDTMYASNVEELLVSKRETRVPSQVVVELLVLIDSTNGERLAFDPAKLVRYVGIFWNSVQSRYASTTDPNVMISLTNLVVFKDPEAELFIHDNKLESVGHVKASELLNGVRDWLVKNPKYKYDAAVLHLGHDATNLIKGKWDNSVAGLAFTGSACSKSSHGVAFAEDNIPSFSGILTATHELGHVLGLPHDGDGDAKDCSPTAGNIMSPARSSFHTQQFSSCSLKILKSFLSNGKRSCLWNTPKSSKYPLLTDLPATFAGTLDEQCQRRFNNNSYKFVGQINNAVCKTLWCGSSFEELKRSTGGAVEGTPCGVRQVCKVGSCVSNGVLRLDEQCQKIFDKSYSATNKNSPSVCNPLVCKNVSGKQEAANKAQDGSLCGNGGYCKDGQCTEQQMGLDDQCKRNFGNTKYFAYNKNKPNEVCSKLWCTSDGIHSRSYGGADSLSMCADNKICSNNTCIDAHY